jgi:hypothetical protein
MPGFVAPVADEREGLLAYLAQQRLLLRLTAYGLTDDQARATPTASRLSIGGLIKHVALVERGWMATVEQRPREWSMEDHHAGFRLGPQESFRSARRVPAGAKETDAVIAGIADLGQPVPVPGNMSWMPAVEAWSVRSTATVHDVDNSEAGLTRRCSVSVVPALSLKLVARRHVDYGRTRSMICMPA